DAAGLLRCSLFPVSPNEDLHCKPQASRKERTTSTARPSTAQRTDVPVVPCTDLLRPLLEGRPIARQRWTVDTEQGRRPWMSVHKTTKGYTIRWYDVDGRERQRTIKGITRNEAESKEREILAARDRGERLPDERHAPLLKPFALTWVEEMRAGWKPSTKQQYE